MSVHHKHRLLSSFLVLTLIISLLIPLPFLSGCTKTSHPDAALVLQRMNSPERALSNLKGQTAGIVTITATWGGTKTVTCTVTVAPPTYSIAFNAASCNPAFSGSGTHSKASQTVVITVLETTNGNTLVSGATVSLSAGMNDSQNQAIVNGRRNQYYGLKVGVNGGGLQAGATSFPVASGITDSSGKVTLALEDIVGERILTLTASVTPSGGSAATDTAPVNFDKGPLPIGPTPTTGRARSAVTAPVRSS